MLEPTHQMARWAKLHGKSIEDLAEEADCSAAHLRNIFAGRKDASLGLAKRLSSITGGVVPMDAFLRPEPTEARA